MTATDTLAQTIALPLIDLNRDRREERRQVFRRSRRYGAAVLAILAAAGAVLVPLTLQTVALRRELGKAERQARDARTRLQSMTAASAQMDGRIGLWERLVQTQDSRRGWGAVFPSLAACLPDDVLLQQVQISGKDGDTEIHIQGSAVTMGSLRAFTTALAASPVFVRVHLDEAVADHAAGHRGLTFRITGPIMTGPGPASPLG